LFKASYFKYADIYSGKYNLIMAYVSRNQDFITGAEYEPMIDTLSSRAESLLYGIKYSEKPLEFEVDIVNPDEDIPMKQMMEIKDWLFGQDGWKKLYIKSPDYENMYLKCLLLPENDIRDSSGYRGVRCKVKNISGFWYGKDEVITYTKEQINALTNNGASLVDNKYVILHPEIKTQCKEKVFPILKFMAVTADFNNYSKFTMNVHNNKSDYESDFIMDVSLANQGKEFEVDCEWAMCEMNGDYYELTSLNTDYDFFYLEKGINDVAVNLKPNGVYAVPSYLSFIYTPKLRVGGF
jgi:hypothetical protein